jgi:hypothetical protein
MGRRSPQSAFKRAREQAMRENLKQAKKDTRAAERRRSDEAAGNLGSGMAGE